MKSDNELKAEMQAIISNNFSRSSDMLKSGLARRFERTHQIQQHKLPFEAMRNFEALQNYAEGALAAIDFTHVKEREALTQLAQLNAQRWLAATKAMTANFKPTKGTVTP